MIRGARAVRSLSIQGGSAYARCVFAWLPGTSETRTDHSYGSLSLRLIRRWS